MLVNQGARLHNLHKKMYTSLVFERGLNLMLSLVYFQLFSLTGQGGRVGGWMWYGYKSPGESDGGAKDSWS